MPQSYVTSYGTPSMYIFDNYDLMINYRFLIANISEFPVRQRNSFKLAYK